jgi:hypothetical protein
MENHHFRWVNQLFRLGHFQKQTVTNDHFGYMQNDVVNPMWYSWIKITNQIVSSKFWYKNQAAYGSKIAVATP